MSDRATSKIRRYRIEELLYNKGGRDYYLQVRNKMLRKFNKSTSSWDKWLKKRHDSDILGDFPAVMLQAIATEIGVEIEALINTPKEKTEILL